MKSKTSFFNKTIFLKNIRRFWLLPATYLFCFIWAMPVTMYFGYRPDFGDSSYRLARMNALSTSILSGYLIVSLVFAVGAGLITAQCVFSYLQRSVSVNFFHSLPSDRKQMFFTNLLSGFAMMAVPVIVTFLISVLVSFSLGTNIVAELLAWLLVTIIIAAFFYLFAVICALLAGQGWFGSAIYMIFLIYYLGMMLLCVSIISVVNVGCDVDYWLPEGILGIISPVSFFARKISSVSTEMLMKGVGNVLLSMMPELIEAVVFIVLFLLAAYYLYKFRKSEAAGDTVAFGFARPIFRWGFAISFSLLLTVFMLATVQAGYKASRYVMIVFLIIFGLLGFIIAQMLIRKSVHVFKPEKIRKNRERENVSANDPSSVSVKKSFGFIEQLACCGAVMLMIGIMISMVAAKVNRYVPDANDVRTIKIDRNYSLWSGEINDRKIIEEVISVHHDIIDEFEDFADIAESRFSYVSDGINGYYTLKDGTNVSDIITLSITYVMNNGKTVDRRYSVPDTAKAYRHIEDLYSSKDMVVELVFGKIESRDIDAAYMMDVTYSDSVACYYNDAAGLFDAFLADVEAGNITGDSIYIDSYIYEIEDKLNSTYDEEGNEISSRKYTTEIPYEIISISSIQYDDMYTIAFTTYNHNRRMYYCVNVTENCKNMLDSAKKCKWMM